ncbi:KAT8 regulatory NSL complex subunit 3 [Biomphalaria pfeifferi]|uniref:KAT8 regulatory NSL complex subunit 3 n=1 Tax=Biomphalaria pfeifferi TaxID=112525 RepID=A0AAD8FP13_BIOPF|nr:KAT8 regulatory NSL complex subunit 3 [Biomphalaria pfeifferi]
MNALDDSLAAPRCFTYSQRLSNELNVLNIDHCYAKPWSSHPEASNARPLHMLFMDKFPRPTFPEKHRATDVVNVEDVVDEPCHMFESSKTSMSDCEKLTSLLSLDGTDNKEDWEEHIASIRSSWTVLQNRNFAKVMRILQADRLARLSVIGIKNEPIQRKLQIDKAAKRVRSAFANIGWDMTIILWLHNLFLENLRGQLLTSYLEVLQTLKVKVPSLVERLIQGTNPNLASFSPETLSGILKKQWDPVLSSINQQKLKKLPENPLLLVIPNAVSSSPNLLAIKRQKFWHSQLSATSKVLTLIPPSTGQSLPLVTCLENVIANVRAKILELKNQFPGRPLILIGWHVGALVAANIASMEVVQGVVCLGFPTMGINGIRGEVDDSIFNCRAPTLFVVGQNASSCSVDVLEDIRERMRVETQLVLVGGADDHLRMSRAKKQSCSVTQTMVDRCIMDEVYQFLCHILSQSNSQSEVMDQTEVNKKQRKRKQKENTASSQTSGLDSKQIGVKPVKALKLAKAVGYSSQLVLTGKVAKRASPKKKVLPVSQECSSKHVVTPAPSSENVQSLSKVSEAEAIASAPELSNLLQNIKKFDPQKAGSNCSSFAPKPAALQVPATIPSTTALTLSKFLQSSGLLRAGTVVKSSTAQSKEIEKSSVLSADTDKQAEVQVKQPQILLRAGTSSSPFSIPLTLNMASKVLKATPMMKITGSNSNSAQIQQLLSTFTSSGSSILVSASSTTHHNSVLNTFLSSGSSTSVTHTPVSSVVDIGSDKVPNKETPASATTVPSTINVEPSHVPSVSSMMKKLLTPSSKISLISSIKQIPGALGKHMPSCSQPSIELLPPKSSVLLTSGILKPQPVPSGPCTSTPSTATASLQLSPSTGLLSLKLASSKDSDSKKEEVKQTKGNETMSVGTSVSTKVDPVAASLHSILSKMTSGSTSLITLSESKPTAPQPVVHFTTLNSNSSQGTTFADNAARVVSLVVSTSTDSVNHVVSQAANNSTDSTTKIVSFSARKSTDSLPQVVSQTPSMPTDSLPQVVSQTSSMPKDSLLQVVSQAPSKPNDSLPQVVSQAPSKSTNSVPHIVTQATNKPSDSLLQVVSQAPSKSTDSVPHTVTQATSKSTDSLPQVVSQAPSKSTDSVSHVVSQAPKKSTKSSDGTHHVVTVSSSRSTDSLTSTVKSPSRLMAPSSSAPAPVHTKAPKTTIMSYTATPKTVLTNISSTRTRKIKTPKQYDL